MGESKASLDVWRELVRLCSEGFVLGHIEVEAEVTGLRSTRIVRMLVDTSSTYLVLPASLAEEIGTARLPLKTKASLANGQEFTAETVVVEVEVEKRKVPATALIMETKKPLLGVEALEAMGFRADPTTRRLEATRGYAVRAYRIQAPYHSTISLGHFFQSTCLSSVP